MCSTLVVWFSEPTWAEYLASPYLIGPSCSILLWHIFINLRCALLQFNFLSVFASFVKTKNLYSSNGDTEKSETCSRQLVRSFSLFICAFLELTFSDTVPLNKETLIKGFFLFWAHFWGDLASKFKGELVKRSVHFFKKHSLGP